jgi:CDP-diacylglycerol--glycerol-3-phosphate 3-phosphatidyltransferase
MLNLARASVARVTNPLGSWLLRHGVTADVVTVIGTVGSTAASLWFFPRGQLFAGAAAVTLFVLFDLLDGAVAGAAGGGSRFGGVLDSVCDRIADGALFAAIAWWCFGVGDDRLLGAAVLVCLVAGQVIYYVKARAEAAGLTAEGGIIERPERLIVALVGTGLHGLGVPYLLDLAMWALAVLSVVTVGQRLVAVYRSTREAEANG